MKMTSHPYRCSVKSRVAGIGKMKLRKELGESSRVGHEPGKWGIKTKWEVRKLCSPR